MSFFNESTSTGSRQQPKRAWGLILTSIATLGLVLAMFLPAPYVIEKPGPTFNVLSQSDQKDIITVSGAQTYKTDGNLNLLTVSVVGNREQTPGWLELLLAWLDPAQSVLPLDQVFPPSQTQEEVQAESTAMMEMSQQDAIAVALAELGYEVPVHVYVSAVLKNAPAAGILVAGDFITSINGEAIFDIDVLRDRVAKYDGVTPLAVGILRKGVEKTVSIVPEKDASDDGKYRMGVSVGYKFDFPVDVQLELGSVGGPSGGMMFALGIYDKLTPGALTGGQFIAGTGTISAAGQIGPIGGIRQKLYGADRDGAEYFLAPSENCDEVIGNIPEGLQVFKVETFDDALSIVNAIGQQADLSGLPVCSTK